MAVPNPVTPLGAVATVAAPGTSVLPDILCPDNCEGFFVYNPSAGTVYIGHGAPGGPLAPVAGSGVMVVPAGSGVPFPIGTLQERAGPVDDLIYDATVATDVFITYINGSEA